MYILRLCISVLKEADSVHTGVPPMVSTEQASRGKNIVGCCRDATGVRIARGTVHTMYINDTYVHICTKSGYCSAGWARPWVFVHQVRTPVGKLSIVG